MVAPKKDLSKEDKATLFDMFDYLCSKIDFGKAALDNTAICCMNNLFIKLRNDETEYDL